MNSKWLIPGIIIGIIVLLIAIFAGTYNSLVQDRENVRTAFSNVKVQYQRRADLVDNLVATVKGSAEFERKTLQDVTDARARVGSVTIDENSNQEQVQQYLDAQDQMSSSLGRLIAVAENYPDLKTTAAFQDLMSQLEGTENRVAVARGDFNEAARPYNARIQTFPTNVVAGMFGFSQQAYFENSEGTENAPKVDFSPVEQN